MQLLRSTRRDPRSLRKADDRSGLRSRSDATSALATLRSPLVRPALGDPADDRIRCNRRTRSSMACVTRGGGCGAGSSVVWREKVRLQLRASSGRRRRWTLRLAGLASMRRPLALRPLGRLPASQRPAARHLPSIKWARASGWSCWPRSRTSCSHSSAGVRVHDDRGATGWVVWCSAAGVRVAWPGGARACGAGRWAPRRSRLRPSDADRQPREGDDRRRRAARPPAARQRWQARRSPVTPGRRCRLPRRCGRWRSRWLPYEPASASPSVRRSPPCCCHRATTSRRCSPHGMSAASGERAMGGAGRTAGSEFGLACRLVGRADPHRGRDGAAPVGPGQSPASASGRRLSPRTSNGRRWRCWRAAVCRVPR